MGGKDKEKKKDKGDKGDKKEKKDKGDKKEKKDKDKKGDKKKGGSNNAAKIGAVLAVGAVGAAALGVAAVGVGAVGVGGYMAYQSHEAKQQDASPLKLKILVHNATNLQAADKGGTSDPFVHFSQGKMGVKTTVKDKELNPVWNEELMFGIYEKDVQAGILGIEVLDKDMVSNDCIGKFHVPLCEVPHSAPKEYDVSLEGGDSKKPQNGKLRFSLVFIGGGRDQNVSGVYVPSENKDMPGVGAPQGYPPQGAYPAQGGYPPQGYPPQGAYPAQGGYPPQGYPPQGAYPSQGGYPPQGAYPSQGGYPPQGAPYNSNYPSQQPPGPGAESQPGTPQHENKDVNASQVYPSQAGGYPPQGAYPSQAGGYPPQGYPPQGAYPSQGGYPPQGAYPSQAGGYPPQGYPPQGAYPSQGGYPPQGAPYNSNYPSQQPPGPGAQ